MSSDSEKSHTDEEEYEAPKRGRGRAKANGVKAKKAPAAAAAGGKKKETGFTKPYKLSKELAAVMGQSEMPRHEVVKKMWAIIKERDLYDPKNKQFAICDDQLLKIFGVKRFRTFGMLKYLKTHFS